MDDRDDRKDGDALNQQEIRYILSGKTWFSRRFRIFWITRSEDSSSPWDTGSKKITISCVPGSQDAVKGLKREVRRAGLEHNSDNVPVYLSESTAHNAYWELQSQKSRRDESTVVVDPEQKKKLFDNIENYLKRDTREWYQSRGIPYRWGCLLYGPPGTGKTSMKVCSSQRQTSISAAKETG